MIRWFFSWLLLGLLELHACALCQLYTPQIEVEVRFHNEGNRLHEAAILWRFSAEFSRELVARYGSARGAGLGFKELKKIQEILLDYLNTRDYLTTLALGRGDSTADPLAITPQSPKMSFEPPHALFAYKIPLDMELTPSDTLMIQLEDKEGFFEFTITQIAFSVPLKRSENLFNNAAFLTAFAPLEAGETPPSTTPAPKHEPKHTPKEESKEKVAKTPSDSSWSLGGALASLQAHLRELFENSQTQDFRSGLLPLLAFSFLYGALHAAGPGHGKMLVGSYFFGVRQDYAKALGIALAIGILHTFSAFLMTLSIYYFFELFFKEFLDNFVFYATKFSALIIMAIALSLLYKKTKGAIKIFQENPQQVFISFSIHPPTCSCKGCSEQGRSTDVSVVLAASLVPCPGTVTIFLFAIALREYFIGFLAALCMSMGMSLVIFGAASLGKGLKKGVERYAKKLVFMAECAGLVVMFSLGFLLLVVD